jgi:hypothetical protein
MLKPLNRFISLAQMLDANVTAIRQKLAANQAGYLGNTESIDQINDNDSDGSNSGDTSLSPLALRMLNDRLHMVERSFLMLQGLSVQPSFSRCFLLSLTLLASSPSLFLLSFLFFSPNLRFQRS